MWKFVFFRLLSHHTENRLYVLHLSAKLSEHYFLTFLNKTLKNSSNGFDFHVSYSEIALTVDLIVISFQGVFLHLAAVSNLEDPHALTP